MSTAATASPATAANPLFHEGLPKFSEFKASHVHEAISTLSAATLESVKALEADLQKILSSSSPSSSGAVTWQSVLDASEKSSAQLHHAWQTVSHCVGVRSSDELQAEKDKTEPLVNDVSNAFFQSKALFDAYKLLQKDESLDGVQKRILKAKVLAAELGGVDLEGEKKEEFNKIKLQLLQLSSKFQKNVLDAKKAWGKMLTTKEEVDGLPESARALMAQDATRHGAPDANAESGPWWLSLAMPTLDPFMKHAKNRALREELYRQNITCASSGETDNQGVLREILQLREKKAKLLGFSTYADLSLATKMAGDVATVRALLEKMHSRSYAAAQKDIAELQAFAKTQGFDEAFQPWDTSFWAERVRESSLELNEEALRAYFPLSRVLDGMFGLVKELFGIRVVPADGEADVWNPDVRFFHIVDDASGARVASFFLDPYSRPAEKNSGAWMDSCMGRSSVMGTVPVAYLVCNQAPPVAGKEATMNFREVETLFHEFGHGLQHMLTNVSYADAAGISGVEWDAVELPSQFMENWCYHKKTVASISGHVDTGAPLPDAEFEKLLKSRTFLAGSMMLRQLYFAVLDLGLHSTYDPYGEQTPSEFQQEIAKQYTVIPPIKEDRFLCTFGHIFAGGYAAGYWSYKWAEVLSADAFGAFEDVGLDNEDKVKALGKKFRDTVLGLGGGTHPAEVFRMFRGRNPDPETLLRHNGL